MNRRDFMKTTVVAGATAALARPGEAKTAAPSDRLAIGVIGCGARAHEHLQNLVEMPGVEVVAVCDAYKGRAERAKSRTGGRATIVQDYHEILAMPGVDAVFIVTPDHWHKTMAVEALAAKKDIYLEKPMSYSIEDGLGILDAVKRSDRIVQIGSQSVSGPDMIKARELVNAGKIGQVVEVRAAYNRNSAGGAWLYPIPPDASPQTVNWDQFLGPAPKRPFDLNRYYQWRLYWDYSGGISTDLLVHQTDIVNFMLDKTVPRSCMASGGTYRWTDKTDDRDVPDTFSAIYEYGNNFQINYSCYFGNDHYGYGEPVLAVADGARQPNPLPAELEQKIAEQNQLMASLIEQNDSLSKELARLNKEIGDMRQRGAFAATEEKR